MVIICTGNIAQPYPQALHVPVTALSKHRVDVPLCSSVVLSR